MAFVKNIELLKDTYESDILLTKIEIQEQTFQNISREIHDNIGQKLSLAKLQLNRLEDKNISEPVQIIGEVMDQLRDLSRTLSSEHILESGLIKALEMEVNHISKVQLFNIKLKVTGDPIFIHSNRELMIFRIAQEAIHNILKHAKASRIGIELHYGTEMLTFIISDDGVGFDNNEIDKGLGLENMKKRTQILRGDFKIQSTKGAGTNVIIKIPYHE